MPNGDALVDSCGVCDSDATNDCPVDCNGYWDGEAVLDECDDCVGGNTELTACVEDECGIWGGDGLTCVLYEKSDFIYPTLGILLFVFSITLTQ